MKGKIKKQVLAAIVSLLFVIGFLPVTVSAEEYAEGGLKYNYNTESMTAEVTGYNASDLPSDVIIPQEINVNGQTYAVTAIGNSAFSVCANIKSVTIPDGVTSIGEHAFFYCENLISVTIPDSVVSIGDSAFLACRSLTSIEIPSGINLIMRSTFSNCSSLVNITIPDGVTSIGDYAFSGCDSLTSITLPDSVSSIGLSAFSVCTSLESISIPDSVTSIGDWAFGTCRSLTSITIPDSVTSIGEFTFYGCTGLIDFYINEDLAYESNIFDGISQQINVWRYKVDTGSEESKDGKTHVAIVSIEDKDGNEITDSFEIFDSAMGDGYAIDKAELSNVSIKHAQVTKTEFKAPTCTKDGNIAYWHCTVCDKYFKDEGLTQEITKEDTILKATGHKYTTTPTWSWNEDNIKAEATFVCLNDETHKEVLEAKVTSVTEDPTVDKEGKITYTATVTFEGKEYTDAKEVVLAKLPSITSGNNSSWNTNSSGGLTFTSDALYKDFIKVLVDDKEVDAKYYTVKEGSTIVTLSKDYLSTLKEGTHTLSIVSVNGTATATFTIKAASITVPDTGNDITNTYLFSLSAILSLGVISAVLLKKRYSR